MSSSPSSEPSALPAHEGSDPTIPQASGTALSFDILQARPHIDAPDVESGRNGVRPHDTAINVGITHAVAPIDT